MRCTTIVLPATLALAFVACSDVHQPVAPSTPLSELAAISATRGETGGKTDICHRTNGSYILISVAAPALDAHFAHGDGRIGDAVPGQPEMRFASDCSISPAHITLIASADGSVRDGMVVSVPKDGTPDALYNSLFVVNSPSVDVRGIIEFDISAILQPVEHAELRLSVASLTGTFPIGPRVDAYVYPGNGAVTLSDFAAGTFAAMFAPVTGPMEVTFDVTSAINSLIAAKAGSAGFNLRLFHATGEYPSPPMINFHSLESPPAPTLDLRLP